MLNAVLFKSEERFTSFQEKLSEYCINYTVLDFENQEWIEFDYSSIDIIIFYPSFEYSSNSPHAVSDICDNINHIRYNYPNIKIFPDPNIINYYNDKYRQYLFFKTNHYPIPPTYPLYSNESIHLADQELGYPMILKNRYGAGGEAVFKITSKKELINYFNISTMNLFNYGSLAYFFNIISKKSFYYNLIKAKRMIYPFLSPPLLVQKYVNIDRDLRVVVGDGKVVEAHWRLQANESQWKVNIDAGGIGEWSKIPQEVLDLSEKMAKDLNTSWVALDIIEGNGEYLITEFSPVWHHYAYKEKPTFVYKDDYNIDVPLETSLDLEKIIIESLINAVKEDKS